MDAQITKSSAGVVITVGLDQLGLVLDKVKDPMGPVIALAPVVRKWAEAGQQIAVENVSGKPVNWSGGTFIIRRRTGKLARSIKLIYITPLTAEIVATAEYADSIESGVDHPVDLKPFLVGKTVPLRFAPGQVQKQGGKYYTRETSGYGPMRLTVRQKYASTGRKSGKEYILFRRIGPRSSGWIIPPRKARPFMRAMVERIQTGFLQDAQAAVAKYLTE